MTQRLCQQRACDSHYRSSDNRRRPDFLFFVFADYMLPANVQADTWVSPLFWLKLKTFWRIDTAGMAIP